MKKEVIILIILGILLISPLALAQEQSQSYSGFNRFTDNVKLFFSSGDNKVDIALEIREKEINSALENLENNKETTENLERARNKLLLVQEKVSSNNAQKVKNNVNELIDKVNDYENLPDEFETYILEEEKTQLTAELVVELDGKEGQTLTREVVKDGTTGQNTVKIIVIGENGEEIITETQGQIGQIQNQIAERVVKIDMAQGIDKADIKDGVYVAKGGDEGLKPEVKTDIEEGTITNEIVEGEYAPGTSGDSPGNTIDETYDDEDIITDADCGEGVDCGDGSAEAGAEGTNDIAPAIDSNEGDSNSGITGEVISSNKEDSFLLKIFEKILGI